MNDLTEQPQLTYSEARAQLLSTINAQEPAALDWIDPIDELEGHLDPIRRRRHVAARVIPLLTLPEPGPTSPPAAG